MIGGEVKFFVSRPPYNAKWNSPKKEVVHIYQHGSLRFLWEGSSFKKVDWLGCYSVFLFSVFLKLSYFQFRFCETLFFF